MPAPQDSEGNGARHSANGNLGAHPDADGFKNVTDRDTEDIVEFTEEFFHRVYVMPAETHGTREASSYSAGKMIYAESFAGHALGVEEFTWPLDAIGVQEGNAWGRQRFHPRALDVFARHGSGRHSRRFVSLVLAQKATEHGEYTIMKSAILTFTLSTTCVLWAAVQHHPQGKQAGR
jgi:hypothetical protein